MALTIQIISSERAQRSNSDEALGVHDPVCLANVAAIDNGQAATQSAYLCCCSIQG